MAAAADELEFELAARTRDRLAAVRRAIEKQQMVADRNEDLDVIGIAEDELEAAVQVFFVRRGRVVGRKGFVLDKVMPVTAGELVERILEELYCDEPPLGHAQAGARSRPFPRTPTSTSEWLTRAPRQPGRRSGCRSGATSASSPRRSPRTPPRSSSATGSAGRRTTTAGPGRSTSCRSTWACPRRRCASSAST